jgi:uncharacterized protein YggT (Ycf19 family)
MVATGLRLIFGSIGLRTQSMLITVVYSLSEPVVRPMRRALRYGGHHRFDVSVFITLIVIILTRYFILPQILRLLLTLVRGDATFMM